MTPDQMTNDLIIGGWRPMRYERNSGDVWCGVYHEDHGLVYMEKDGLDRTRPMLTHAVTVKDWPRYLPNRLTKEAYLADFKCRWVDVEPDIAALFNAIKGPP